MSSVAGTGLIRVSTGARRAFLGRQVPTGFDVRVVVVAPGCARPCVASDWLDSIVVVDAGRVELATCAGARATFTAGDILVLGGLAVITLANPGAEPTVLVAISRGRRDEFRALPRSIPA